MAALMVALKVEKMAASTELKMAVTKVAMKADEKAAWKVEKRVDMTVVMMVE